MKKQQPKRKSLIDQLKELSSRLDVIYQQTILIEAKQRYIRELL